MSERPPLFHHSLRCRLGLHKMGLLEPARRKVRRFEAYQTYCVRCDKRLT